MLSLVENHADRKYLGLPDFILLSVDSRFSGFSINTLFVLFFPRTRAHARARERALLLKFNFVIRLSLCTIVVASGRVAVREFYARVYFLKGIHFGQSDSSTLHPSLSRDFLLRDAESIA